MKVLYTGIMAVLRVSLRGPRSSLLDPQNSPERGERSSFEVQRVFLRVFNSFEKKRQKPRFEDPRIKPRLSRSWMSGMWVSGRMGGSSRRYIRSFKAKRVLFV